MTPHLAILVMCLFNVVICERLRLIRPTKERKYRSDYLYIASYEAYYKVSEARKTWSEAKTTCEAEGAELAVFRYYDEAISVQQSLILTPENKGNVCSLCYFWIGLQNVKPEVSHFYQLSVKIPNIKYHMNETVKDLTVKSLYNNWNKDEPAKDQNGNDICLVFLWNGKFNYANCKTKLPYICRKYVFVPTTPNHQCNNFDLEYKRSSLSNHCYKFHKDPRTYADAYMICKAELAHLAIINSVEEANIYSSEWAKYSPELSKDNISKDNLFLGFHDMYQENNFVTIFGDPLAKTGYTNWEAGQPDNRANIENCGGMSKNGELNDINCNILTVFVCEKNLDDIRDDVPSYL